MKSKTFKSLDEQINILRDKGLVINDEVFSLSSSKNDKVWILSNNPCLTSSASLIDAIAAKNEHAPPANNPTIAAIIIFNPVIKT